MCTKMSKYLPLRSVSLYDQRFPRYRTFYHSPLTTMLNIPKKKQKMPKIQNFEHFTMLYTTLVETLPRSMHEFLEANLLRTFRQDVV